MTDVYERTARPWLGPNCRKTDPCPASSAGTYAISASGPWSNRLHEALRTALGPLKGRSPQPVAFWVRSGETRTGEGPKDPAKHCCNLGYDDFSYPRRHDH